MRGKSEYQLNQNLVVAIHLSIHFAPVEKSITLAPALPLPLPRAKTQMPRRQLAFVMPSPSPPLYLCCCYFFLLCHQLYLLTPSSSVCSLALSLQSDPSPSFLSSCPLNLQPQSASLFCHLSNKNTFWFWLIAELPYHSCPWWLGEAAEAANIATQYPHILLMIMKCMRFAASHNGCRVIKKL